MNIVRLVVLAILFYIAWRLLRGLLIPSNGKKKAETVTKVQDVLVEDPQCHKLVPKNQAVRCRLEGKTYYFCSDTCCDKFTETQRKEE
ncbi:MAG: YHS domain-containing protein [Desulfobulbaceae bacterium]|nr:YHS domain-containing protein [Desulfobulbaceae bacterium]